MVNREDDMLAAYAAATARAVEVLGPLLSIWTTMRSASSDEFAVAVYDLCADDLREAIKALGGGEGGGVGGGDNTLHRMGAYSPGRWRY